MYLNLGTSEWSEARAVQTTCVQSNEQDVLRNDVSQNR
eukprot:SAG31_NODE_2637_length_5336_cov_2.105977_5_plen_38_part_00